MLEIHLSLALHYIILQEALNMSGFARYKMRNENQQK